MSHGWVWPLPFSAAHQRWALPVRYYEEVKGWIWSDIHPTSLTIQRADDADKGDHWSINSSFLSPTLCITKPHVMSLASSIWDHFRSVAVWPRLRFENRTIKKQHLSAVNFYLTIALLSRSAVMSVVYVIRRWMIVDLLPLHRFLHSLYFNSALSSLGRSQWHQDSTTNFPSIVHRYETTMWYLLLLPYEISQDQI